MVKVLKRDGRLEEYDASKIRKSLANSGADEKTIDKVMAKVDGFIYDGVSTKEIFKFVIIR